MCMLYVSYSVRNVVLLSLMYDVMYTYLSEMLYPTGRELCRSLSHDPNALLHRPSAVYGLEKGIVKCLFLEFSPGSIL